MKKIEIKTDAEVKILDYGLCNSENPSSVIKANDLLELEDKLKEHLKVVQSWLSCPYSAMDKRSVREVLKSEIINQTIKRVDKAYEKVKDLKLD